jgi:glycerol-3-phosphate acyltransferase PlsY
LTENALFVLAGYLAGSLPFGYWLVRLRFGEDIRGHGSGNMGATNVWRSFGARSGLAVAVLDLTKGLAPALAASLAAGRVVGLIAGAAAMLGHWRPLFLGFRRGGKMVATCGGVVIGIMPLVALVGLGVFALVFLTTRYVSLASIVAAVALIPTAILLDEPLAVVIFVGVAAVGIIWLHRGNIARLVRGQERRVRLRRRRAGPVGPPEPRTR